MILHAMGISYKHDGNFRIDRPNGSGDNLLLIFKTEALMQTDSGNMRVPADSAVVYAKGCPQIYGACGDYYENHWVHFECSETDIFFERIGLRFNVPMPVPSISQTESVLEMLSLESLSEDPSSDECRDLLLRLLIAKICGGGGGTEKSVHSGALRRLRAEIYGTPSGHFTVEGLASRLLMSPSHFQALYKAEFGVSCYEDVLRAKTAAAAYYLRNTGLSVKEISELCGYENDVHFIRQFKQRTGMTALEYRNGTV